MPYFSNKPAPTPGYLLPKLNSAVIKEPEVKQGTKRKHDNVEVGGCIDRGDSNLDKQFLLIKHYVICLS